PDGGYGHPDHIQAHRVAMRAAELAAEAGCGIARTYWNRVPRPAAEAAFARLGEELPGLPFDKAAVLDDVPGVVEDERIGVEIVADGTPYAAAKAAAMRAHVTQIEVAGAYFALSNELAQPLFTTEYYELVGAAAPERRGTDLFAGIEEAS
ncbi:N-acetyl-1-D-myo-inositol-2-amino-2-deoxy-alpha-D-glucopyranoside deacetylase, partial [Streptomyces sp. TRM76130]|nr:N-acetyl-1-D-myo-inositol-2-amino-2-deoxy-alpha-D-glucopyranoside deacetylase [Streptomyces sp. TRM76130]